MKKIKGKYIRLTEAQLNSIIQEEIDKRIQYILEYAEPRKNYIEMASNLTYQIIENWCLVHYCTLIGRTETKEHWKSELYSHIDNIGKKNLKGNNNYDSRLKAIIEGFNRCDAFEGPERILQIVRHKFDVEKINLKSNEVLQTVADCSNNMNDIASVIANYFNTDINEYLNKI